MNTPGHAVLNLAVLGREDRGDLHVPIAVGALLPDAPMLVFYAWARLVAKLPEATIWSEAYFAAGWQLVFDVFHSIPLALAVAALGWWAGREAVGWLGASVFLHGLVDLPLHADDAHAHFLPLTDARFESPISYWDPSRHGGVVAALEIAVVGLLAVVVWRRLETAWGRALLALGLSTYVLEMAWWGGLAG